MNLHATSSLDPGSTPAATRWGYLLAAIIVLTLSGCATIPGKQVNEQVAPLTPDRELSDAELLNISIQVFDPGQLPE